MGLERGEGPLRAQFQRVNLADVDLVPTVAHGGDGRVGVSRVFTADDVHGCCTFVDVAVLSPGTSIGIHRHRDDEEEYYLVLEGTGEMTLEDEVLTVGTGDLVRNRPGGLHGLVDTGEEDLRLFVFEVPVHRGPDDELA